MRTAAILMLAGLVALVIAVASGSTVVAVAVVVLAAAGIVLLLRDWREQSSGRPAAESESPSPQMRPDEFAPDISTDPDGPSSDARAGQT